MRLPQLTELPAEKEMTEEFLGYNHNIRINNGEWYDQKNMTTDYYPVASPRAKRQITRLIDVENPITFTVNNVTYTVEEEAIGGCVEGDYITLHRVKQGTSYVGIWFMKGNHLVGESYPAEIKDKMAYFKYADGSIRNLVRMGSYVCVFPDGIVYETANTTDNVPVFKVQESITFGSGTKAVSVIKRGSESFPYYTFIVEQINQRSLDDGTIRYDRADKLLQRYIADDAIWVNQPTYVVVLKNNTTGTFGNLKVGDVISIVNEDMASGYTDYSDYVDKTVKIIDKGTLASGKTFAGTTLSADTDYIVFEGLALYLYDVTYGTSINLTSCERKMPVCSHLACESQNRLWTCDKKGHEIYASALGNPYNFYDYSGLSTDSYAVNVGTQGEWTGCVNYLNNPLFFKENSLHAISGSYPTNQGQLDGGSYAVTTYEDFKGCKGGSDKSFAVIDNILYYYTSQGVVAFDGANTTVISSALGTEKYGNAVAAAKNGKYYVSMQDISYTAHFFAYDTKKGMWSKEDNLKADFVMRYNGDIAFVGDSIFSQLENVQIAYMPEYIDMEGGGNEPDFDWMCESGVYGYSYPNNKYVSRFQIRLQVAAGATASVFIQYDSDGVWHKKGTMENKGTKTYLLPIVPRRCDHMKLRFTGKGDVKIISIAKIMEEGGDV